MVDIKPGKTIDLSKDHYEVIITREVKLVRFGPKPKNSPAIVSGHRCPACEVLFKEGDYTTLVPIGPGPDESEQRKCRDNEGYNATGMEAHWICTVGKEK